MKTTDDDSLQIIRFHERGRFEKNLREEIIKEIESGVPRSVISYRYGISRARLSDWMTKHSSVEYQRMRQGKRLTDIEKRSIVRAVQQGSMTRHAARKTYGLGPTVLARWLRESVKENVELAVYDPFAMEKKPSEQPQEADPEKQALKKALEEAQLKISALNTLIDVAEDQFKIAIRKKAGAKRS